MHKIYKSERDVCRAYAAPAVLLKSILLGLSLGISVLAAPMLGYALPQVDKGSSGVTIQNTSATQMDIASSAKNNVLEWHSFDIAKPETVQFDHGQNTNNYLNIINDSKTSVINGALKGGNNIYLINPNGVLFGASSSVNVGSLYVSTRPLDEVAAMSFAQNGTNPLSSATGAAKGDIVNLGTMVADYVLLDGGNITFTNKLSSLNGSQPAVDVKAGGMVMIGLVDSQFNNGNPAQGLDTEKKQFMHLDEEFAAFQSKAKLNGTEGATPYYLVRNVYELQNMRNNTEGNYMLAGDIDAAPKEEFNIGGQDQEIRGFDLKDNIGLPGNVDKIGSVSGQNNGQVHGTEFVGGLVGQMEGSGISGYNIGKVADTLNGNHVNVLILPVVNSVAAANNRNSNIADQVSSFKLWTTGDVSYINDGWQLVDADGKKVLLLYDRSTMQPLSKSLTANKAE